jgi:hypothetical protein
VLVSCAERLLVRTGVADAKAAIEGDGHDKVDVHRAAIAGAFAVSKHGPPTVRFIWEKFEHFIEHAERGRPILAAAALRALEEVRRAHGPDTDPLAAEDLGRSAKAASDRGHRKPMTRAEIARVRVEYEEIAARTAPAFRCVLEALIAQCRVDEEKARE